MKTSDPTLAKKFKKVVKIPQSMKVTRTSLNPLFIELRSKKLLGKKVVKRISLPNGSYPMAIFYRPRTNEIHIEYIKKFMLTKRGKSYL